MEEGLPNPSNGTLKKHWRRRKYRRLLDATIPKRKKLKIIRLGGSTRPLWRIKAVPKFHLNVVTPLNIWKNLKDAYINMMLKFAGNFSSLSNTGDVFRGMQIANPPRVPAVCGRSREEYESKMVFEIFKSLVAYHRHIEAAA
ncbi:hypothetical protein RHSIM_Rhsim10G0073300 [Rhododendron simsii]|uniref:Uncharacterized protein n=1 Tax=Rhododendron simsii TaxID=118357 RepID=A0A834LBX9_RHOSS|nr:hypothetical protein RHSIM_Rhsim10G0073300 [Rhododendron simsii]